MEASLLSGINRNLPVLAIVLCVGLFSISRGVSADQGSLDGKVFIVENGSKGEKADGRDVYLFRNGMFVSSGCVEQNFGKSSYSADAEGNGIRFRAEMTSPTVGTMYWEGFVRGDAMEATSRWVHDRWYWKVDRQYWYRGGPAE